MNRTKITIPTAAIVDAVLASEALRGVLAKGDVPTPIAGDDQCRAIRRLIPHAAAMVTAQSAGALADTAVTETEVTLGAARGISADMVGTAIVWRVLWLALVAADKDAARSYAATADALVKDLAGVASAAESCPGHRESRWF